MIDPPEPGDIDLPVDAALDAASKVLAAAMGVLGQLVATAETAPTVEQRIVAARCARAQGLDAARAALEFWTGQMRRTLLEHAPNHPALTSLDRAESFVGPGLSQLEEKLVDVEKALGLSGTNTVGSA